MKIIQIAVCGGEGFIDGVLYALTNDGIVFQLGCRYVNRDGISETESCWKQLPPLTASHIFVDELVPASVVSASPTEEEKNAE